MWVGVGEYTVYNYLLAIALNFFFFYKEHVFKQDKTKIASFSYSYFWKGPEFW